MPYREPEFLPWDGRRVPLTFVGGYLGAGKTTAINAVLAHADRPIAVIVNDVGAVNIDARLVRRRHGDTIELTNGCVCCTSIDEIGAAFDLLRARATPPDHVVVELSGVAEPQNMLWWGRSAGFQLDGLVVVVAADQLAPGALADWVQGHIRTHVAAADLLVLTKTDAVDEATAAHARATLAALAPGTPVFLGGVDRLESGALGRFLALGGRHPDGPAAVPDPTLFDAHHTSLATVPTGLDVRGLAAWLEGRLRRTLGTVVRAKGFVDTVDDGLVLVQVVGRRTEITPVPAPERTGPTDLVIITLGP